MTLVRPFHFFRTSALLLLASALGWSQVGGSSLTGTVTDQQGKRIPHAKIRVVQTATGLQRLAETTSQGNYELVNLPAGIFSVQISAAGFASFQAEHVEQVVGQTRTLDAALNV